MTTTEPGTKAQVQKKLYDHFQAEAYALEQQIDRLANTSIVAGERIDATEHCLAGITRLSNEVNEAADKLPAYDQRTYSDSIKRLKAKLDEVRAATQPKPKFSFKSRAKNNSAISLNEAAELAKDSSLHLPDLNSGGDSGVSSTGPSPGIASPQAEPDQQDVKLGDETTAGVEDHQQRPILEDMREAASIRKPSFSQSNSVAISNHSDLHIVLPQTASRATSSGVLSRLRHCVVDMSHPTSTGRPFASVTLKRIEDSLLICGQVSGPLHVTGLDNVVVVVSTGQFRMHDSKNCVVYLHCTSKPIIERCERIRVAPLPSCYIRDTDGENRWDQVNDFNWLRSEPNPHWRALTEPERIEDHVWREVVPGGPKYGLEDILKAVNIE